MNWYDNEIDDFKDIYAYITDECNSEINQKDYLRIYKYFLHLVNNQHYILIEKILSVENICIYSPLIMLGILRTTRTIQGELINWKMFRYCAEKELDNRGILEKTMFMGL